MQRNCFNIEFYCRPSKVNKKGLAHIEMSLSVNGDRHFYNTPMMVRPEDFNKKKQPKDISDYCNLMRSRINEILTDMLAHGEPVTSDRILSYLRQGGYRSKTVEMVFNEYLSILRSRVDNDLTIESYRKYQIAANLFYKEVGGDREFSSITNADILSFKAKMGKKYAKSSQASVMTKVKTMYRFGLSNGYGNGIDAFNGVKIEKPSSDIEYLTEEEIAIIRNKHFSVERLERVRDLAVLMMASGLSYCDCMALQPEDVYYDTDGTCYIFKKRQKTNVDYMAVVFPDGVEILKKYNNVLPTISNQRGNGYLSEIQSICGIEKKLHFHLFRKTYGTRLLNRGVRLETVSKCLGHSSTAVTQASYAKLLKNTIIEEVKAVF